MTPLLIAVGLLAATPPSVPLAGAFDHLSGLAACVHPDRIDRGCVARAVAAMTPEERAALAGFLAFDQFYGQQLPERDDGDEDRDEPPGM